MERDLFSQRDMDLNSISYLSLNYDHQQLDRLDSALSSIVSSPSTAPLPSGPADSLVIRELIGRLGTICNNKNSGAGGDHSTNTSCYSTPLSSPPNNTLRSLPGMNPNPMTFPPDQGFAERAAARMPCFGGGTHMGMSGQGQLSRVSSSQSLMDAGMTGGTQLDGELTVQENGGGTNNGRKRKAGVKGKGKEGPLASTGTTNSKVLFQFYFSQA